MCSRFILLHRFSIYKLHRDLDKLCWTGYGDSISVLNIFGKTLSKTKFFLLDLAAIKLKTKIIKSKTAMLKVHKNKELSLQTIRCAGGCYKQTTSFIFSSALFIERALCDLFAMCIN